MGRRFKAYIFALLSIASKPINKMSTQIVNTGLIDQWPVFFFFLFFFFFWQAVETKYLPLKLDT